MNNSTPFIPLSEPCLNGKEKEYILQCIDTNFISSIGPFVTRFEEEFAKYVGSQYAVACASGTAALHIALILAGVSENDLVMAPTFSFIASVNPIMYQKATPILVDSEPKTWNMDPELIIGEIRQRVKTGKTLPKAIILAHILGHPANIEPLIDICLKHNITIIEDAAEALGATYSKGRFQNKHVGAIGEIGCYSFNGNKIISTGGGGMIVTNNPAFAKRAKSLTTQAKENRLDYWHNEIGYNYRLTNLAAALGVAQLEQLPNFLVKKRRIAENYNEALSHLEYVYPLPHEAWANPSFWLYCIRISSKILQDTTPVQISEILLKHGVQTRPLWTPLHLMPMYKNMIRLGGSHSESLFREGLTLPTSVNITKEEQNIAVKSLMNMIENL